MNECLYIQNISPEAAISHDQFHPSPPPATAYKGKADLLATYEPCEYPPPLFTIGEYAK